LRYEKVARLSWQAYNQNALLTQEEIARILNMSVSGIKKIGTYSFFLS
jgi:DNA-binding transcriptional regulator LsrR (DeoR family)